MKSLVNRVLLTAVSLGVLNLACAGSGEKIKEGSYKAPEHEVQNVPAGYDTNPIYDTTNTYSSIRITKPADGKIVRRSRSMIDPLEVCLEADSIINPDSVLKADYRHSKNPNDSLNEVFAIIPGSEVGIDRIACIDWWNTEDLAEIENGQEIYISAEMIMENLTSYTSLSSKIIVDTKTPILGLYTKWYQRSQRPDTATTDYIDTVSISGFAPFFITLDEDTRNPREIIGTELWAKKHEELDVYNNWFLLGNGAYRDNSVEWNGPHWIVAANLTQLEGGFYDLMPIAMMDNGSVSYDYDGDGNFNNNAFQNGKSGRTYFVRNER